MNSLRVGLAQINVTVGAFRANADRIVKAAEAAARRGCDLVAFPELALCGNPPEDLLLKPHFVREAETTLRSVAKRMPPGLVAVVGAPRAVAPGVRDTAWVLQSGGARGCYDKMRLSNYGVFDEQRLFAPGPRPGWFRWGAWRVGLHIGKDSWDGQAPPCAGLRGAVDLVLNIAGSPYHRGKSRQRESILGAASKTVGAPLLYCNLVGGQDELVFDGASLALEGRRVLARARHFEEDLLIVDLRRRTDVAGSKDAGDPVAVCAPAAHPPRRAPAPSRIEPPMTDAEEVYAALRLGLRDYVEKCRFPGVILALSGGIDSALAAAVAVDAVGAERVRGLTLPSRFSSAGTRRDAHRLAAALGIRLDEVSIEPIYTAVLAALAPLWPGRAPDTTEENLQARIRGAIVMALSNKTGAMVVATGNKSEFATGYCTLYGDMAGGFAVLKDVPKTLVYRLARWRNRVAGRPLIPESVLRRAPSAELRAHQRDQDSLPPYRLLDAIIERYVERDLGYDEIVAEGFEPAIVRRTLRLIDASEYKRRQSAPGVKITPKAFGRDRRMPIVNAYREPGVS